MSAWIVIPCLLTLRAEFNALAPKRDKGADGTIGDSSHTSSSDHTPDEDSDVLRDKDADKVNEVHALDIDVDLNQPGLTLERCVQHILAAQRAGDGRLRYIIFNKRIWSANNGWKQSPYAGKDPHTNHAHFSASYETKQEARTDPWMKGLIISMAITDPEFDKFELLVRNGVKAEIEAAFARNNPLGGGSRDGQQLTIFNRTGYLANTFAPATLAAISAIPTADVDEEAIADAINAEISDTLANTLLDKLKARLES